MSISEFYQSGVQKNNIAQFAAIANIACTGGQSNEEEKRLLNKFAYKLNISEKHFTEVLRNPSNYPINPPSSKEGRLQYLYDLFRMIFADNVIDEKEMKLIHKYAIGLGCSSEKAKKVITKSIKIFGGKIAFEDYQYLINKE
ncbi:TerB family tellurite resistance protein [Aquimarina sediminis]|uniref:TerB family tellurite resistance protein n=1 Tax=Aquimarina sediminis TaxID=2070536 RepID=UPI000CA03598|nr:TerB family tellurite resistance protein [Aquimarina sediminis]